MASFTGKTGSTGKPIGPRGFLSRLKGLAIVVPVLFVAATLAGWISAGEAMAASATSLSDLYVMDVTGNLTSANGTPMQNTEIQAWVLMKSPNGPVVIDNWEEKKYVFEPQDGNWTAAGLGWVFTAYYYMKPVTVYLKVAKGVPVAIEESAQLGPGQWRAYPLTFDPVVSEIKYGDQVIGHVPFNWVPRNIDCSSGNCTASPNAWATTDANGEFLIHIVNPVDAREPVVFTVNMSYKMPLNNIVEGDKRLAFDAVYNNNSGSAKVFNLALADVHEPPVTNMDNNIRVISFPVKKIYYIGDQSGIPGYAPGSWARYEVTRPCEAMVEMVYTDIYNPFPAVCWNTPEAAVTADGTGIHSSVRGYNGDIKAVLGGHAMMGQIDGDEVKVYMFGQALDSNETITLTAGGANQGWYLLYNWNSGNNTARDMIDTNGIDYVIYPSELGFRSRSTNGTATVDGDLPLDLELEGGVIIHVTGDVAWPVQGTQ